MIETLIGVALFTLGTGTGAFLRFLITPKQEEGPVLIGLTEEQIALIIEGSNTSNRAYALLTEQNSVILNTQDVVTGVKGDLATVLRAPKFNVYPTEPPTGLMGIQPETLELRNSLIRSY